MIRLSVFLHPGTIKSNKKANHGFEVYFGLVGVAKEIFEQIKIERPFGMKK